MSPLAIVGQLITISCYLVTADVSHILQGTTHPSNTNAQAVNSLVVSSVRHSAKSEFWWQDDSSPLKKAYDQAKDCQSKSNCAFQHHDAKQINRDLAPAGKSLKIDLSRNPFFNGNVTGNARTLEPKIDLSKNPFFSGHGQLITDNGEGFLGVQPAELKFPKSKPLTLTHPLTATGECSGSGYICVPNGKCKEDGYATADYGNEFLQIGNKKQKCNTKTEVCCRLSTSNTYSGITPGKSSVLNVKKSGLLDIDVQSAGESGAGFNIISTTAKPVRDVTVNPIFASTIDYSNTVFGDTRFGSTIKGPDYLPPFETTTTSTKGPDYIPPYVECPAGQVLINGRCEVSCGPGQKYINGRCQCPPNTHLENGRCVPVTPRPTPPSCPPGQQYINGRCQCTGNTIYENGRCIPITTRPTPPTVCPPNTHFYNGRCIPSQPVGPDGYIYDKPDEPFDSSNTVSVNLKPTFTTAPPNTYIPPVTPESTGSTFKNNYITPDESNVNINVVGKLTTPPPQQVSGCAAALKCVQEIYCTPEGFISPVPVVLDKEQLENRVPLANCTILDTASEGKCCRDPNYKDPWPSANLVNGVDNGQYKEDNTLGQYSPDKQRSVRSGAFPHQRKKLETQSICGVRNYNTQPKANNPLEMNFAEIPWQAMILRDSSRTLLCGGSIISPNAVLTTAHCVDGIESRDILVKGGEWKLGVDEEPQPFQIVKVAAVARHPNYRVGNLTNDMALLILSEKLRLTGNVGTVCLPSTGEIKTDKCMVTGWGKKILQVHLKNALMNGIEVDVVDEKTCRDKLESKYLPDYGPNTICGKSQHDQCKADYGSALACEDGNGQYRLVGVYSWDTGCKSEDQIGAYIKPDISWVQKALRTSARELRKIERDFLAQ